ncbi:hypothetical protein ABZS61_07745 [Streptomyces sp. NPDC005566]|uniref:hypothetical protein n=1 Tax=Streptomyces sp. NPDC005566 TaxID=3156886 RepID=UPI0033B39201
MRIGPKTKAIGTVLTSGVLVIGMSTAASAATTIPAGSYGRAEWNADPAGSTPGDALRACDTDADGYGVKATLMNSNYDILRTVTTSGLSAGQCSAWKGGNLPEHTRYLITTFRTKAGDDLTLDHKFVSSSVGD